MKKYISCLGVITVILSSSILAAEENILHNFQKNYFVKINSTEFFKKDIFLSNFSKPFDKNINIYGTSNIFKYSEINNFHKKINNEIVANNIEVNIYGENNKLNVKKNFFDELKINIGSIYDNAQSHEISMEYQIFKSIYKTTINSVGTGTVYLATPQGNITINGS
tara:strand:- start:30 stop:527 length:498 start_codon:yes stop_codon:yes gene_type:complete